MRSPIHLSILGILLSFGICISVPDQATAHDIVPPSLVFDKTVNVNNPATLTFDVTDGTGCNADITATSFDPSVVTVSPAAQEGVSVTFTVTKVKRGPANATIRVTFKGKGTDSMGGPCLDDAMADVPVEIKPGILEVFPPMSASFVTTRGTPLSSSSAFYSTSNIGDDTILVTASSNKSWIVAQKAGVTPLAYISTLSVGETDNAELAIVVNDSDTFDVGFHTGEVTVTNATNGMGNTTIPVTLLVGLPGESIVFEPSLFDVIICSLNLNCSPSKPTQSFGNSTDDPIDLIISGDADWLFLGLEDISSANDVQADPQDKPGLNSPQNQTVNKTLAANEAVNLTMVPNSNINSLGNGTHTATITYTNSDTNEVLATQSVNLVLTDDPFQKFPKDSKIVSPYWQADSSSYTFIAVSHPSLSGMSSQIGVAISAIANSGVQAALPVEFTLASSQTRKVFIATSNNPAINSTNFPNDPLMILGQSGERGMILINPVATQPKKKAEAEDGAGFRDVTQLNLWGSVVLQDTATGFAMEFIGDQNDSRAVTSQNVSGLN